MYLKIEISEFAGQKSDTLPPCCQSPHFVGSFSASLINSPVSEFVVTSIKSMNLMPGDTPEN